MLGYSQSQHNATRTRSTRLSEESWGVMHYGSTPPPPVPRLLARHKFDASPRLLHDAVNGVSEVGPVMMSRSPIIMLCIELANVYISQFRLFCTQK